MITCTTLEMPICLEVDCNYNWGNQTLRHNELISNARFGVSGSPWLVAHLLDFIIFVLTITMNRLLTLALFVCVFTLMYGNAAEGFSYEELDTEFSEAESEANFNRILELKKQGFEGK